MSFNGIRKRLEAATPGPWFAGLTLWARDNREPGFWPIDRVAALTALPPLFDDTEEGVQVLEDWCDQNERGTVAETHTDTQIPGTQHDGNQALIAHAPTDLRLLLDVVEAAQAQGHRRCVGDCRGCSEGEWPYPHCVVCGDDSGWPCPTKAALDALEAAP